MCIDPSWDGALTTVKRSRANSARIFNNVFASEIEININGTPRVSSQDSLSPIIRACNAFLARVPHSRRRAFAIRGSMRPSTAGSSPSSLNSCDLSEGGVSKYLFGRPIFDVQPEFELTPSGRFRRSPFHRDCSEFSDIQRGSGHPLDRLVQRVLSLSGILGRIAGEC